MDVTQLTQLIGNLGFPIFTALFMMLKQSKDTQAMTSALSDLKLAIEKSNGGKSHE